MATTRSNPRPRSRSSIASSTACKAFPSPRTGVMSLKRMPGWGKSGTSRMRDRASSREAMPDILAQKNRPPVPWGGWDRRPRGSAETEDPTVLLATRRGACKRNSAEETQRVARPGGDADFEMQMWPGGIAGAADAGDRGPPRHFVAPGDQVLRVVGVHGDHVAIMREQDQVAVSALLTREEHHAVVRCPDGRPLRAGEVDPVVAIAIAIAERRDQYSRRGPGEGLAVRGRVERPPTRARDRGRRSAPRRRLLRAGGNLRRRHRKLALGAGDEECRPR